MQPLPLTGHHCSAPFDIPCIDMCTDSTSEIRTISINRTVNGGPSGVLIIEVSLYMTAFCGPNGVLIIEVSLYRTAYCFPSGVLVTEVSLYII